MLSSSHGRHLIALEFEYLEKQKDTSAEVTGGDRDHLFVCKENDQ